MQAFSAAKWAALLGTHRSRVGDLLVKFHQQKQICTVSQAAMLPKQNFQYHLSYTLNTKVFLRVLTTTFWNQDFPPAC